MFHGERSAQACCQCGTAHVRNHRYCAPCFVAYMREWRRSHPLTAEQRAKDSARSYAGVYKRRGHLDPRPCESCGSGSHQAEMHHPDYGQPLKVEWLCRPCHIAEHRPIPEKLAKAA